MGKKSISSAKEYSQKLKILFAKSILQNELGS